MQPKVISFHYTLKNSKGETLESSFGDTPFQFLEGAGNVIPGLEEALVVLAKGEKKTVNVPAADAYGEYDKELLVEVSKDVLPKKDVQVGDQFQAEADGEVRIVEVKSVTATHVTMDANHPLAGQDLTFDVEILDTRAATKEEVEHGHAHGPGGHHHH